MKHRRRLLLALLGASVPLTAHAYIDPGSGMLIWQGLLAAMGAVIVFARQPIQVIKGLIKRIFRR